MALPTPIPNNPNDLASRRIVYLATTTQGQGVLARVEKIDFKDDRQTTLENEVGNDEPAGFKDKPGGFTVSIEQFQQTGNPWPDWDALKASKDLVIISDQIIGGNQDQYGPCRVSKVDKGGDKDGGNTVSVELVSIRRKRSL